MEEYVYVLDYLPQGRADINIRGPIAYSIGELQFTILSFVPKQSLSIGERVYVGKELSQREKVEKVLGRVKYEELTSTGRLELPGVLEKIVKANEKRFVVFVNNAQPISLTFHVLELLPGFGKKKIPIIVDERKKGPFLSFEDIASRTHIQMDKLIAKRIELEITNPDEKYRLFVPR